VAERAEIVLLLYNGDGLVGVKKFEIRVVTDHKETLFPAGYSA